MDHRIREQRLEESLEIDHKIKTFKGVRINVRQEGPKAGDKNSVLFIRMLGKSLSERNPSYTD